LREGSYAQTRREKRLLENLSRGSGTENAALPSWGPWFERKPTLIVIRGFRRKYRWPKHVGIVAVGLSVFEMQATPNLESNLLLRFGGCLPQALLRCIFSKLMRCHNKHDDPGVIGSVGYQPVFQIGADAGATENDIVEVDEMRAAAAPRQLKSKNLLQCMLKDFEDISLTVTVRLNSKKIRFPPELEMIPPPSACRARSGFCKNHRMSLGLDTSC
jgi:hypothetical protein